MDDTMWGMEQVSRFPLDYGAWSFWENQLLTAPHNRATLTFNNYYLLKVSAWP
jgi:hypothetical protein